MAAPGDEVAIVIASHGRPRRLAECLAALARLEGGPFRAIVVDDGSPEPLAPVCRAAGPWVECLRQDNAGPGAARNRGVQAAEGARRILFTDDDCRPRPDWALRMLSAQAGAPMRLVGGRVENRLTDNPYSAASQAVLGYAYRVFDAFDGPMAFFTTNNMCLRRADFLALGGFDRAFRFAAEDRDLCRRWKAAGGALHHAPDAVVDHGHALDLRAFWRQHVSYGRGARRFHRSLAGEAGGGVEWGSLRFYAGLVLHPLRRPSLSALRLSALIALSHLAMLFGYLGERRAEAGFEAARAETSAGGAATNAVNRGTSVSPAASAGDTFADAETAAAPSEPARREQRSRP
jgi:GT2 family glycosyltransferase